MSLVTILLSQLWALQSRFWVLRAAEKCKNLYAFTYPGDACTHAQRSACAAPVAVHVAPCSVRLRKPQQKLKSYFHACDFTRKSPILVAMYL